MLAFPDDPDTGITYTDVRHKVGCCGTLRNWAYDQILEEPLKVPRLRIECSCKSWSGCLEAGVPKVWPL